MMPSYEYKCPEGHITEVFAKIDDRRPSVDCICGEKATRIISPVRSHLFKPMELELETNKPKTYESKKELKADCQRLGKAMPGLDIY